ncbi:MAG: hypothetical protein ACRDSK_23890 [Actinophytocola sp.]|uniref:WD40/YVTN/BNR-like repeat-containing protein n=1 Tax=Actinophytocola sp. TaxID=1872138 RepID=UPI003D6B3E41
MPDLDLEDELARLRDGVRETLPVPDFDQVVGRHRQRVVRRRMQIGAVVAVLVVSLAVPLLREQMIPDPPPPPVASTLTKGPFISGVGFIDAEHGFVIRARCAGRPVSCSEALLATDDGTRWDKRPLPRPDSAPSWARGWISVLGTDELTVDWPLSPGTEGTRSYRMHSTDGGRTWDEVAVPGVVTETVSAIPEHGALIETCAELVGGGQKCAERTFAVVQPGSGESALLANRPPLTAMAAGSEPTLDGRWWVAGRDPRTDNWGLAVSDDDGRTWTTTILDWAQSVDPYGWSVVSQGGTLYATAIGALSNTSNGLQGVFRSADGGRTWEQTWRPADDKQPRRVFSSTVAGEDGSLTINAPDGMYLSRDGGRTFTKMSQRYPAYAGQTRTGYIAVSGTRVVMSTDGVRWQELRIG